MSQLKFENQSEKSENFEVTFELKKKSGEKNNNSCVKHHALGMRVRLIFILLEINSL